MRLRRVFAIAATGSMLVACQAGPKSALGFRLPDGDAEAGQAAFVALKCSSCHRVHGVAGLPEPVAGPPVPIALGGEDPYQRTDGELVTAIIDPSHRLATSHPDARSGEGSRSRMGDFSEAMTVRQLIDVVAFLHAHYEFVPPQPVK